MKFSQFEFKKAPSLSFKVKVEVKIQIINNWLGVKRTE